MWSGARFLAINYYIFKGSVALKPTFKIAVHRPSMNLLHPFRKALRFITVFTLIFCIFSPVSSYAQEESLYGLLAPLALGNTYLPRPVCM